MVRNINIKYAVGDSVRYLNKIYHQIMEVCPCCSGDGKITGKDGEEYYCPKCEAVGQIATGKYSQEINEKTGTISSVHVHYDSNGLGAVNITYRIPQADKDIKEEDIIERIISEEEMMGYTE